MYISYIVEAGATIRLTHFNIQPGNSDEKRVVENATQDIEATCMGELLRMLAHPVIQRSQQLTDRLLRLLALVSAHLPSQTKAGLSQTQPNKGKVDTTANSDGSSK